MRSLVALFALTLVVGCGGPTHPTVSATAEVSVSSITTGVEQFGDTRWLSFEVPVTITNAGPELLRLAGCGQTVEQSTTIGWKTVWRPACQLLDVGSEVVIAAGESRVVTFVVGASLDPSAAPRWESSTIAGSYRLRIGVWPQGGGDVVPTVVTNAFTLAEP